MPWYYRARATALDAHLDPLYFDDPECPDWLLDQVEMVIAGRNFAQRPKHGPQHGHGPGRSTPHGTITTQEVPWDDPDE